MGQLRQPLPVKYFFGILSSDQSLIDDCTHSLAETYGRIDISSPVFSWDHSAYYREEMGSPLYRTFVFLERLRDPGELPLIKHQCLEWERKFAHPGTAQMRRRINLDPGYLTEAKVVLASTKDFSHRIFIGNGIYAEVTLAFDRDARSFCPIAHTYPDFRSPDRLRLFNEARGLLRKELGK